SDRLPASRIWASVYSATGTALACAAERTTISSRPQTARPTNGAPVPPVCTIARSPGMRSWPSPSMRGAPHPVTRPSTRAAPASGTAPRSGTASSASSETSPSRRRRCSGANSSASRPALMASSAAGRPDGACRAGWTGWVITEVLRRGLLGSGPGRRRVARGWRSGPAHVEPRKEVGAFAGGVGRLQTPHEHLHRARPERQLVGADGGQRRPCEGGQLVVVGGDRQLPGDVDPPTAGLLHDQERRLVGVHVD